MQAKEKSYFDLLGVSEQATDKELKAAYVTMLRKYPPEQYPNEVAQINRAYTELKDPVKRQQYLNDFKKDDTYAQLYAQLQQAKNAENHLKVLKVAETLINAGYDKDKKILCSAAEAAVLSNDYKLATRYLNQLKQHFVEETEVQYFLSDAYYALKEYDNAIYFIEKIVKKDPQDNRPFVQLVNLHRIKKDMREASRLLEQRIPQLEARPQNYPVLHIAFLVGVDREYMPLINSVKAKLKEIAKKDKEQLLHQMVDAGADIYVDDYAFKAFTILVEELNARELPDVLAWTERGKTMFEPNIPYFELYPEQVSTPVQSIQNRQPISEPVQRVPENTQHYSNSDATYTNNRGSVLWSIVFAIAFWMMSHSFVTGLFVGVIWYFFADRIKRILGKFFAIAGCLFGIIVVIGMIIALFS